MNMKRTLLSTSLARAVAGFLGTGAALAQQYNAPAATAPTPATTAPAPATTAPMPATTAPTPAATPDASKSTIAKAVVPMRTESGPAAFAQLDVKHQGFLKSEDVSQLQGFNFKTADKNNDGKLDATEFNAGWALYSATPKS